jgi:hypothetical protein
MSQLRRINEDKKTLEKQQRQGVALNIDERLEQDTYGKLKELEENRLTHCQNCNKKFV